MFPIQSRHRIPASGALPARKPGEGAMDIGEIRADRIDSGGHSVAIDKLAGKAMPRDNALPTTETETYFHAVSNFVRTFDFRADDRLVFLTDKLLDPRVVSAISGLALAQGIRPMQVMSHTTNMMEIPDDVKPILEKATFVVSTWFCSAWHPYCLDLRRTRGHALQIPERGTAELLCNQAAGADAQRCQQPVLAHGVPEPGQQRGREEPRGLRLDTPRYGK